MSKVVDLYNLYCKVTHAMQTGVSYSMHLNPKETQPKSLRVAVNSAHSDHTALAKLLLSKGVITEEEYLQAIVDSMKNEVKMYEDELTSLTGAKVTLL